MGETAEIAQAALFSSSESSSFITATELFADGGIAQL
jgi:NAD(P)-dependent dehydrogenase (short-subunit alcohol dehydrogenase family)